MLDKWKTLRLLLEGFAREAKDAATSHLNGGREKSADLNSQTARVYDFVLGKMEQLDVMVTDTMAVPDEPKHGPDCYGAIPQREYVLTGRPVHEAPAGLYRVIFVKDYYIHGGSGLKAALCMEDGKAWLCVTTWAKPEEFIGDQRPGIHVGGLYWSDIKALIPIDA